MAVLRVGTGQNGITASTDLGGFAGVALTDLEGWDDFPEQERNSAERVGADGDFVSKYMRRKSKTIIITIEASMDSIVSLRAFRADIEALESQPGLIDLELTRTFGPDVVVETYTDCYINSNTLWKQLNNTVSVNMSLKTKTPWKQQVINGGAPTNVL
jgi:hypothetical protein